MRPDEAWNLPASQSLQVPEDVTYFPAVHSKQSELLSLPAGEVPCTHGEHVLDEVAPETCENLPTSHEVHGLEPFDGLNLPAAQLAQIPMGSPSHSTNTVANNVNPEQEQQFTSDEVSMPTTSSPVADMAPEGVATASTILLILAQLLSSPPLDR